MDPEGCKICATRKVVTSHRLGCPDLLTPLTSSPLQDTNNEAYGKDGQHVIGRIGPHGSANVAELPETWWTQEDHK
eukprot:2997015-Pyramimonas_sp.AAC.1